MKLSQVIILVVLVLLFALSVVVGEIAFRLERTALSYGFTYREMQHILAPLDDPETHRRTVSQAFGFIRQNLSFTVPREVSEDVIDAAVAGFSPAWIKQTMNLWLVSAQQVLHGAKDDVEFPVSLSPFKNAFLSEVRGKFTMAEQMEINQALDDIPTTFDLADEMPEDIKQRMLSIGRSMGLLQVLFQYVVPGVLILVCFFHRRLGTGILGVGAGLVLAGVPSMIFTTLRAEGAAGRVGRILSSSLPDFLSWVTDGVQSMAETIVRSGTLTAVAVTVSGLLLVALGLYLVVRKGDPQVHFGTQ